MTYRSQPSRSKKVETCSTCGRSLQIGQRRRDWNGNYHCINTCGRRVVRRQLSTLTPIDEALHFLGDKSFMHEYESLVAWCARVTQSKRAMRKSGVTHRCSRCPRLIRPWQQGRWVGDALMCNACGIAVLRKVRAVQRSEKVRSLLAAA